MLIFLYTPTLTYMTTGKTIALTRQTFFGKVMSLLLNMLSILVNRNKDNPLAFSNFPFIQFILVLDMK